MMKRPCFEHRLGNNSDKTVAILTAFIQYLPTSGAQNIAEDILQCQSDWKPRQLTINLLPHVRHIWVGASIR